MKRKLENGEENVSEKKRSLALLSMQIDDWLGDTQIEENKLSHLKIFAKRLETLIMSEKDSENSYQLSDLSWLSANGINFPLVLPFGLTLEKIKSSVPFSWKTPKQIEMLSLGHMFAPGKSEPFFHMEIIIPREVFGSRDFLNFTYHVKRALYLCWVAQILKKSGLCVDFTYENFSYLRPLLTVKPCNDGSKKTTIFFHASPDRNFIKLLRFRNENNNLRHSFCMKSSLTTEEPPTPFYNTIILEDLVRLETTSRFAEFFANKQSLTKAISMVRQWLQIRNFMNREDGVSDFLINAWFLYLYTSGAVSDQTSVVKILEIFYTSIGSFKGIEKQYSLTKIEDSTYEQFKKIFEVVVLDFTGYYNIAYSLTSVLLDRICVVAVEALQKLHAFSEFESLFLKEQPFSISFDVYVRCSISEQYFVNDFAPMFTSECVDRCGDYVALLKRKSLQLLEKAWSTRIRVFDVWTNNSTVSLVNTSPWRKANKSTGIDKNCFEFVFGAQVLPGWDSLLTRGPQATSAEARQFREFWGDICQLRKFADNAICEAIVWSEHAVFPYTLSKICRHILHRHLKIGTENFLERSFSFQQIFPSDLERYNVVVKAYNKLAQLLRLVQDLPLAITNVHPVSSFLRRTNPFPPPSTENVIEKKFLKIEDTIVFPTDSCTPPYLPSVEIYISMEQSGKWGEDLAAISQLKTAFYIALAKSLKEKDVLAVPYAQYLLIILDTVLFRLIISYPKEIQLMRKMYGMKTGTLRDSPESKALEREVVIRPNLAAYLQSTSYMGFLHFLLLLSTHNWLMEPLFVDFTGEWEESDLEVMRNNFIKLRPVLPVLVVYTPADPSGVRWTKENPHPLILKRIVRLAETTSKYLKQHILDSTPSIFQPHLSAFDVLIYLDSRHSARRKKITRSAVRNQVPVFDYDPVENYLNCLHNNFDSVALFFFDRYCLGDKIGVVWKQNAIEKRAVNVTNSLCRMENKSDGDLSLNVPSIMEDFLLFGNGIVAKVISSATS